MPSVGDAVEASFSIRKYQSRDNEECRNLWRELTERHREIYHDPTIGGEHPEDYFDRHLGKVGSENLWVAISDSKVGSRTLGAIGSLTSLVQNVGSSPNS